MMSISKCPRCLQLVTVPEEGVDLDTMVQCPLCRAEYPLRESVPPALLPVGRPDVPVRDGPDAGAALAEGAAIAGTADAAMSEAEEPEAETPALSGSVEPIEPADAPSEAADSVKAGEVGASAPEDAAPVEPGSVVAAGEAGAAGPASAEPAKPELPVGAGDGGGSMFGFLHQQSQAPGVTGGAAGAVSPVGNPNLPSFADPDTAPSTTGAGVPTSALTARPRRRGEKSVVKEMVGAIIGGFVGLSLGYYGLNYFGGERLDFLRIWLPGVAHTQKHWTGAGGDEAGQNDSVRTARPAGSYPAAPKPEGALQAGISRYLDRNFQHLVMAGQIRPESNQAPVPVDIDGEEYLTAADGEIIETLDHVQIGGARLKQGFRLQRQGQWWVELEQSPPEPDPVDVAGVDPSPLLPPVDLPEVEPEPKTAPLPPGYIGPRHRGSYSLAQLGEALKAAHTEFQDLEEHEAISDAFFGKLSQLAERLTFVDVPPGAPGLFDRQAAVENMLEDLGLQPMRVEEIASRALARLDDLDAAGGGIVVAGTAGREVARDGLHGTMLAMPGAPSVYNVLSDKPLGVEEGDIVLVAGVAVTNPSENLIGYPGTRPVVVWAATAVRLPKPFNDLDDPSAMAPAEATPVEEMPAEETPAEETPAEESPVQETQPEPLRAGPAEESPAEEPTVDAMPAEESPAADLPEVEAPAAP